MTVQQQLFGQYQRLKKDLSAAYSQPQWNAQLVDRLVDEIATIERQIALHAPIGLHSVIPGDEGRAAPAA